MKPSKFMVSVQWGGGPHYFVPSLCSTFEEARRVAVGQEIREQNLLDCKRSKRGARPSFYVWEMKDSITPVVKERR
jgi:hypothetical protein